MLVQKIFPKTTSYLAMTVMLAGMSAPALMANNSVAKEEAEKRIEITKDNSKEINEKNFSWFDAISIGGILSLLGICKLADYIEKKEEAEEAEEEQDKVENKQDSAE